MILQSQLLIFNDTDQFDKLIILFLLLADMLFAVFHKLIHFVVDLL